LDYLTRRERVLARLRGHGLDGLVVTRMTNIRYLTGFTGSAGVLLLGEATWLMVDFRYAEQARQQVGAEVEVDGDASPPRLWPSFLERLGAACRGRRVGYEAHVLTAARLADLEAVGACEPVRTDDLVEAERVVKDADEVALLRRAAEVADEVLAETLGLLRPGMTENELAGEIERIQRRLGAERSAAPLIVASGERSSLPHGAASQRVIGAGEPVLFDLSPVIGGYRADLSRTVHLGPAGPELRRAHRVVLEAQARATEALRPGLRTRDADAVARDHIDRNGFGARFNHSLGHGIGLDQHEAPLLSPHDGAVLQPGMVVTIEPGIYLPGLGGVRLEDAAVITDDGCEVITGSDRALREL
jgi:Xaa-Pro aminopeptidase